MVLYTAMVIMCPLLVDVHHYWHAVWSDQYMFPLYPSTHMLRCHLHGISLQHIDVEFSLDWRPLPRYHTQATNSSPKPCRDASVVIVSRGTDGSMTPLSVYISPAQLPSQTVFEMQIHGNFCKNVPHELPSVIEQIKLNWPHIQPAR